MNERTDKGLLHKTFGINYVIFLLLSGPFLLLHFTEYLDAANTVV